jgi:two-component sensor histidine kinase
MLSTRTTPPATWNTEARHCVSSLALFLDRHIKNAKAAKAAKRGLHTDFFALRALCVQRERRGPLVNPPARKGFGTRVLDTMIRGQLKGEMRVDWRPEGLVCEITLPT